MKKKITNIYQCLSFITAVQLFYTVSSFRKYGNSFRVTWATIAYTNIVMAACVFMLWYGIEFKISHPEHSKMLRKINPLTMVIGALEVLISSFTYIVVNISCQIKKYRHIEIVEKLNELDNILIKEFRVNMNYYKMFRKNIILMTLFLIYYYIVGSSILVNFVENDLLYSLGIVISYLLTTAAAGGSNYACMNFADLVRVRFRLMQKIFKPEFLIERFPDSTKRSRKIGVAVQVFKDYHRVIEMVNEVFGPVLLIVLFHDFTLSTSQVFLLFWKATDEDSENKWEVFRMVFMMMLPSFWKMFFSPLYTHLTMFEASKSMSLITYADQHTPTEDVKIMTQGFCIWKRLNKTSFSISGFFVMDLSLGFSVVCAIASYLLVLVQFKMQEEMFTSNITAALKD